ncbi:hypothetical protein [Streptomyces capitiformicae]|nr:hypothetical protein [Streptomyces capitiformicae]
MMLVAEHLPARPRKASASRRRRHHSRLPYRLHQHAPAAASILLAPVWTDTQGPQERVFVARALDANGEPVRIPPGGSRQIASLLQGAFPGADWNQAQTWHAKTNQLTTWQQQERRVAA